METRLAAVDANTRRVEAAVARIGADVAATRQEMGEVRRNMTGLRTEQVKQGKSLACLDGRAMGRSTAPQVVPFVLAVFGFGLGLQFWGG